MPIMSQPARAFTLIPLSNAPTTTIPPTQSVKTPADKEVIMQGLELFLFKNVDFREETTSHFVRAMLRAGACVCVCVSVFVCVLSLFLCSVISAILVLSKPTAR
jgi:hypothetical protein